MTFKVISTLIKREYWENYPLLYRLPLWLGVIICVIVLALSGISLAHTVHFHSYFSGEMEIPTDHPMLHLVSDGNIVLPIFSVFLWITLFSYALRTLFTDRKDGSIFFWNSMPTPNTLVMLAKLFTLLIIAPLCSWIFLSITQWVIYIAVAIGHFGFHLQTFSTSHFLMVAIKNMFANLYDLWFVALWVAPILGLCFISGSYAKRSPAVPVFVILFLACILDLLFTHSHIISGFIIGCFTNSINGAASLNEAKTLPFCIGLVLATLGFVIAGVIRSKNLDFRND